MHHAARQGLLALSLLAALAAFGFTMLSAEVPERRGPIARPSPFERLQDLYADRRWGEVLRYSAKMLDESAWPMLDRFGKAWPNDLSSLERRTILLLRALAAERYAPPTDAATDTAETSDGERSKEPEPEPVDPRPVWKELEALVAKAEHSAAQSDEPPSVYERAVRLYQRGWARRGLGDDSAAQTLFREALDAWQASLGEEPDAGDYRILAILHGVNDEPEQAFERLAQASALGYSSRVWPQWTVRGPALSRYADDPRMSLAVRVGNANGNDVRRLMKRGEEARALWLTKRAARYDANPDDEILLFHAILLERSDDPDDRAFAPDAWRGILSRYLGRDAADMPLDAIAETLPAPATFRRSTTPHKIGWAFRQLGRPDLAEPYFERYLELMRGASSGFQQSIAAYNRACGHALLGRHEQAIEQLELSAKLGYSDLGWALEDFDLNSLPNEMIREALTTPPEPEASSGPKG